MKGPLFDPSELIAPRLKMVRLAYGFKSQASFAKELGIEKNTYNPFEKGKRPLSFEVACLIRRRFKIPVEWLFFGENEDQLPALVFRHLGRAA